MTSKNAARPPRSIDRPPWPERPVTDTGEGVRLQKVLAAAGVGSRRACEDMIARGKVSVDGKVVREQGVRVDPDRAVVRVDGERIQTAAGMLYLALNKPKGVLSAMSDPHDRINLANFLPNREGQRLFHVGRLDADTEGLILLTNDGELAHRLSHPSYGVLKTYVAEVPGPVARDLGRTLREGLELEDGFVSVDSFRVLSQLGNRMMVEVVLHEGRKHIVRRLLAEVGHPVQSLVRTQVGPVHLGALKSGRTRPLGREELGRLFEAARL